MTEGERGGVCGIWEVDGHFWLEKTKGCYLLDLGIDGKIILK